MNRTQLADAMIEGKNTSGVTEKRGHYISVKRLTNECMACALGAALIGQSEGDFNEAEKIFDTQCDYFGDDMEVETCADLLDIPKSLAIEIEHRHLNGQSIEQIAAWLKGGEQS